VRSEVKAPMQRCGAASVGRSRNCSLPSYRGEGGPRMRPAVRRREWFSGTKAVVRCQIPFVRGERGGRAEAISSRLRRSHVSLCA